MDLLWGCPRVLPWFVSVDEPGGSRPPLWLSLKKYRGFRLMILGTGGGSPPSFLLWDFSYFQLCRALAARPDKTDCGFLNTFSVSISKKIEIFSCFVKTETKPKKKRNNPLSVRGGRRPAIRAGTPPINPLLSAFVAVGGPPCVRARRRKAQKKLAIAQPVNRNSVFVIKGCLSPLKTFINGESVMPLDTQPVSVITEISGRNEPFSGHPPPLSTGDFVRSSPDFISRDHSQKKESKCHESLLPHLSTMKLLKLQSSSKLTTVSVNSQIFSL